MRRLALGLAATVTLATAALSQDPTPLVLSGQTLPGGAKVSALGAVHVDQYGGWLVETITDEAGEADDEAVYFENSLWLQEGPVSHGPVSNLPEGSRWLSFDDVRASSANGIILFRGHHDDPTLPGDDETYLAHGYLCGSVGILCGVEREVTEGDPAPGLDEPIEAVRVGPGHGAISPSGSYVMWSCKLRLDADTDGCVYRLHLDHPQAIHLLVAREGDTLVFTRALAGVKKGAFLLELPGS